MVNEFLNYLKFEKRYSEKTILAYKIDIQQFVSFLFNEFSETTLEKATYNQIRSWVVQLSLQETQASSLKRKVSALKSFFKFIIKKGIIDNNPADKITTPKLKERLPKYFEQKNINNLLNETNIFGENDSNATFKDTPEGKQDKLIIEMLYQTGMRRQELIDLKWEAIDFSLKQLKITGKGNKQRLMPCSEKLLHLLEEHKATQNQRFEIKKDKNYIFLTNNGQQLYPNYVYRLIKEKFRNVVAEKKSPHVLRHSFATHISNNGAKLSDIKELMGHASLASTQVYTHNTIEQLKEVYKKAHPKA
ncbi:MAG TPA: tyrosine-type recombinase/integrase [Chitinophagales bacterium]|nr:tyrosine-type recombinase/integrase [Chitinophagales bacterium]MCB9074828.1 tyrosine-type recombinase/integrase [Chitinophagales bacterium]HMU97155.1 tyrosine-type recombinase/integrase [Chitinophagales bacterium]HMV02484.1 tyrosine-type recombinase/integrase [Chitinophagales bacterium]HMW94505.1 tyrosine-type recombinase/integrase [Chitinophagales bacterium]